MPSEEIARLAEMAERKLGLFLSEEQIARFSVYADMLLEWNTRVNLTRITAPEDMVVKHFLDSLVLAGYELGGTFCDVGTGAGFPGIPLKIAIPDLKMTLVDSAAKKVVFLRAVCAKLSLKGAECLQMRVEDLGHLGGARAGFDSAAARGVAVLPVVLEYVLPLLKRGGLFFALKGTRAAEEIAMSGRALGLLGGEIEEVRDFGLGPQAEHRALILVRKVKETPAGYPRRAGIPGKKPLL
ncbi:ribosomal RNA small subunit methyltransferase G [Peptococcaceae bacterium CEB3]|nr:ribosomal RNA small subunit methyltransferase G [Peptococcaceae bacterium CEB3]